MKSFLSALQSLTAFLVFLSVGFGGAAFAAASGGVVGLSTTSYQVSELAGSISFPVSRTGGSSGAASVHYKTLAVTASNSTDYQGQHGVLSWASGDTAPKTIRVKIFNSGTASGAKKFSVILSNPVVASLGTANATVTITASTASASTVSLASSSFSVPRASSDLTVTVARAGNVGSTGAVNYQTNAGTAVPNVDYQATTGVLTWAAGDGASKSFKVRIDAPAVTGSRVFSLQLFGANGVTLGSSSTATVTIGAQSASAVPSVPTNLSATAGQKLVSLNWAPSTNAPTYHVKRATTSGGAYAQVAAPTSAAYTDTSVADGTKYFYVVSAVNAIGESPNSAPVSALPTAPSTPPSATACGMQLGTSAVTFCDTFDAPAGNGNRAGDLNGNVWGVSRTMGVEFGQQQYNMWNSTLLQKCDGTTSRVNAPKDVIICNGQVREASNDNNSGQFENGTVTALAMYPKQPFDFAGRTGTVSFDVSNDTAGTHAAWPEFWLSDLPVPVPFNHFGTWQSLPANGFGIRFAASAAVGNLGSCQNGNNLDKLRWTVDSAVVVRGYVMDDTDGFGTRTALTVTDLDCVIEPSGPGQMNHVEVRISQNQIDVYATDAGVAATPATLKHIAMITNANLTLTRGLIWLEDVHYNADKGDPTRPSQREHTFAWDNVAFDGPFTYRDFSYDALDNTAPGPNGAVNLGKFSLANQTSSWNVANLPANPQGSAARVLFNFSGEVNPDPTSLTVIVNGHTHTVPWPFPDQLTNTWRTYAVTIPLTDLVAGTNVVQLGATTSQVFSNVNIVLVDVPGGVPVLPGSNNAYPSGL